MTSVTSASPAPSTDSTTTPKTSSFFAGASLMRAGLNEVASTPPPTTPPPPPPDPHDYEKSIYKDRVGEQDLSKLKEQVRILKGLPLTVDKDANKPKIDSTKAPKVCPRGTFTSCKRKELQQHRMLVRCANLKEKYREYESNLEKENADEIFRQLRSESMAKTVEQVDHEFNMEELENLKTLATKAKEQEVVSFKETHGSKLRYRYNRGQPVISDNFRNSYDDYFKPPFTICRNIYQPKIYQLPKIDKKRETWYIPVDDDQGIPLHRQMKSPDPNDKRTKREKTRPPVKSSNRRKDKESKESTKSTTTSTTQRPAWRVPVK